LQADYVTVLENRHVIFAEYRLPVIFGHAAVAQFFATAELVVVV